MLRLTAILSACLATALSGAALAQTTMLASGATAAATGQEKVVSFAAGDAQVRVPLPVGFCALDARRPAELAWIASTLDNGYTLGLVDCQALEQSRRTGEAIVTDRHISLRLAPDPQVHSMTIAEGCAAGRERNGDFAIAPTAEWRDGLVEAIKAQPDESLVIGESQQACTTAALYDDETVALEGYMVVGGKWIEIYAVDGDRQTPEALMAQYRAMIRLVANIQAANRDAVAAAQ